jgi:hypothetical protein
MPCGLPKGTLPACCGDARCGFKPIAGRLLIQTANGFGILPRPLVISSLERENRTEIALGNQPDHASSFHARGGVLTPHLKFLAFQ